MDNLLDEKTEETDEKIQKMRDYIDDLNEELKKEVTRLADFTSTLEDDVNSSIEKKFKRERIRMGI